MESSEFYKISTDIKIYTFQFQEEMLHFLRDVVIARMYPDEAELERRLQEYNENHPKTTILSEQRGNNPLDQSPYGRMDLAGAMKILRYLDAPATNRISERFQEVFVIKEAESYGQRLKIGSESRNIFAHYNQNQKITFTKDDMQRSMRFFMEMFRDIERIDPKCARFDEQGREKYLKEKEESLASLRRIYEEAKLHTNLLPYTVEDIVQMTGADEKEVRMRVEYYDIRREGQYLYSPDRATLQAMIESLRSDVRELPMQSFFPVAKEKKILSKEEMLYAVGRTAFILDFSGMILPGTVEYLYRYGQYDLQRADTSLYIDADSMEKLRQVVSGGVQIKEKYRKNAKDVFKKISELREYLRVQYIHDYCSAEEDAAGVIAQIPADTEVCFLTGDREKVDALWGLGRQNLAVLSADVQGRLTINLGREDQITAVAVLDQTKGIRARIEKGGIEKDGIEKSGQQKREDGAEDVSQKESADAIIRIEGGIPTQGLYAPQMQMSFSYYEPHSESGAEGTVYHTNHGDYVVKIFHEDMNTVGRRDKVCEMLKKDVQNDYICWPKDALYSSKDGKFIGYVMRQVKQPQSLNERIEELALLAEDEKSESRVTRINLMEYCKKIAE